MYSMSYGSALYSTIPKCSSVPSFLCPGLDFDPIPKLSGLFIWKILFHCNIVSFGI